MIDRAIPALLVALAIAITGCGGGDSSASGDATTLEASSLSKAQYIKRVDAICLKGSEDLLERLTKYMTAHESPSKNLGEESAEGVREVVLPEVETQIGEIESLGAPDGDESEIEAFLAAQQHGVQMLAKRHGLNLRTDLGPPFGQAGDLARRYGIESCAYG